MTPIQEERREKERKLNKKHKWYCWQCGELIGSEFVLWSLNDSIDRVFIICSKSHCLEILKFGDGEKFIIRGQRKE